MKNIFLAFSLFSMSCYSESIFFQFGYPAYQNINFTIQKTLRNISDYSIPNFIAKVPDYYYRMSAPLLNAMQNLCIAMDTSWLHFSDAYLAPSPPVPIGDFEFLLSELRLIERATAAYYGSLRLNLYDFRDSIIFINNTLDAILFTINRGAWNLNTIYFIAQDFSLITDEFEYLI